MSARGIASRTRTMHRARAIGIKCIYRAQIIPDLESYRARCTAWLLTLLNIDWFQHTCPRGRKELRVIFTTRLFMMFLMRSRRAENLLRVYERLELNRVSEKSRPCVCAYISSNLCFLILRENRIARNKFSSQI